MLYHKLYWGPQRKQNFYWGPRPPWPPFEPPLVCPSVCPSGLSVTLASHAFKRFKISKYVLLHMIKRRFYSFLKAKFSHPEYRSPATTSALNRGKIGPYHISNTVCHSKDCSTLSDRQLAEGVKRTLTHVMSTVDWRRQRPLSATRLTSSAAKQRLTGRRENLHLDSVFTNYGKTTVRYNASEMWNQLPSSLNEFSSVKYFSNKL